METVLSILAGIGLSAACGFRVFVPMLAISVAALSGHLTLSSGFQWLATYPALVALSVASVLEIVAFYIPWLDNMLDAIASPAAVIAGVMITASVVHDMSPFLKWTLAIIAGGGAAGLVQLATVSMRGASLGTTGGLTNPVVSTVELGGSILTSVLAIFFPALAIALLVITVVLAYKYFAAKRPMPQIKSEGSCGVSE